MRFPFAGAALALTLACPALASPDAGRVGTGSAPSGPATPAHDGGARADAGAHAEPGALHGGTRPDAGAPADAQAMHGGASPDAGPAPDGGVPPRGLACLTTWYQGRLAFSADAGWGLALDAGFLPWVMPRAPRDAGEEEEEDDTQVTPSLKDIYEVPYQTGPIVPVKGDEDSAPVDPGRVRVLELFTETYGGSRAAIAERLAKVRFAGVRYPFHQLAAPALERVAARLDAAVKADVKLTPFLKNIGGTWNWRRIARSPALSSHAFGIAIDLNVERSTYWRWQRPKKPLKWQNKVPQAIVDAFEAEGFIWGGRWIHYDTMHFEYRPELTSAACREP